MGHSMPAPPGGALVHSSSPGGSRYRSAYVRRVGSLGIAPAALELISRHIHSVEQLEVLLLCRAVPDKAWTPAEVARALVTGTDTASLRLVDLAERGLLRVEPGGAKGYRYAPPNRRLDASVDELAEAYATRRVTVIGLIFSKPDDAATAFADAFLFRRSG